LRQCDSREEIGVPKNVASSRTKKRDEFLAKVQQSAALPDRKTALRWSTTVLSALAQMLPDSEARRHFVSPLPGFLKSHLLAEEPRHLKMTPDAFLQHIGHALDIHVPEAERALRAVHGVLNEALSPTEMAALEARLPEEIAALLRR
jgi:uncharacterized protein (DUF2267 family)